MKQSKRIPTTTWLAGATVSLILLPDGQAAASIPAETSRQAGPTGKWLSMPRGQYAFHHENVLGTSFEMLVRSVRPEDAAICEQQVLAEIERLRLILSIYDPSSEISRLRTGAPVKSQDLKDLFSAYALWNERTDGAIDASIGDVIRLWKTATTTAPTATALAAARTNPCAYNIDALGKSYVIDRAVAVARRFAPSGLLNIGGDLRTWGNEDWLIGIADPSSPAENSPLLGQFTLRNGAVATSGGYSRFITLAGKSYSHIIDPRTLHPVTDITSASMVASDCLTANALATAANILGLGEGVRLAKWYGAWEYLLINARGQLESSTGIKTMADDILPAAPSPLQAGSAQPATNNTPAPNIPTTPALPAAPVDGPAWPTNYQLKINLNLKAPAGGRARRPYVAVWVQDSKTNLVRTLAIWGSEWRWLREMSSWWKVSNHYADNFVQSITRATRAPGNYVIAWDGLNDNKQPVPQGEYKIFLEINREHGRHLTESVTIQCGSQTQSVELRATPESEACRVEFGPKAP